MRVMLIIKQNVTLPTTVDIKMHTHGANLTFTKLYFTDDVQELVISATATTS